MAIHLLTATCGDGYGTVYMVTAPDKVEATLLKATKTLVPTRLYGLAGYDILLLVPVGAHENKNDKRATRAQALGLAAGFKLDGLKSWPEVGQRQKCAWCDKTSNGTPFMVCSGCKNGFYCSREHQKLDWKNHKEFCQRTKAESFNIAMKLLGLETCLD